MNNSKIEWTDHTFNPWVGCTKVSAGCLHCYAEAMDKRFHRADAAWGAGVPRRRTSPDNWKEPLRWQKMAAEGFFVEVRRDGAFVARGDVRKLVKDTIQPGDRVVQVRPRVFCASMADWLDDEVPVEWRHDLLALMRATAGLDWLLLSKRIEGWQAAMELAADGGSDVAESWLDGQPPANVWIGTSVETQRCADARIPALLGIPARVRFLSCEPLLGAVDLWAAADDGTNRTDPLSGYVFSEGRAGPYDGGAKIHWVICGGESGDGARPVHVKWARSLRDQCASAGVAFFFKQWGEYVDLENMPDETHEFLNSEQGPGMAPLYWKSADGSMSADATFRVGKRAAGRMIDGVLHGAFPENVPSQPRGE